MPRRYRTSSKRSGARSRFRLQAVESVKKCSWECFREGTKSRPVVVRLAGTPPRLWRESRWSHHNRGLIWRLWCCGGFSSWELRTWGHRRNGVGIDRVAEATSLACIHTCRS